MGGALRVTYTGDGLQRWTAFIWLFYAGLHLYGFSIWLDCRDGLHLYGFSKDSELKKVGRSSKANIRQVGAYRSFQFVQQAFEDDCFQPYSKLAESLGVGRVRVLLRQVQY